MLHQAAVVALHKITVRVNGQQQADGILRYLDKHKGQVGVLALSAKSTGTLILRQLPHTLQLQSLDLEAFDLQLQHGRGATRGFMGVLGNLGVAGLKRLRLADFTPLDGEKGLAVALSQLPVGLEHLSIRSPLGEPMYSKDKEVRYMLPFPTQWLQRMQQLASLELADVIVPSAAALQPLQALTRLVDLRLIDLDMDGTRLNGAAPIITINAGMLSGAGHLTHLQVAPANRWQLIGGCLGITIVEVEPATLAGMTMLQHLSLRGVRVAGAAAGEAQLLSHLQPMQQLTHLSLRSSLVADSGSEEVTGPTTAYGALTASSMLQHLDISKCWLHTDVWQHMFPAGRQLPHLTTLDVADIFLLPTGHGVISPLSRTRPASSLLVSCCPSLHDLCLGVVEHVRQALCQLTEVSAAHAMFSCCSTALAVSINQSS
jgi:hypothetical protein